jgi:hypothetical protein
MCCSTPKMKTAGKRLSFKHLHQAPMRVPTGLPIRERGVISEAGQQTTTWYGPAPRARWKLILMQVPFDLASRLSSAALLSGRSPEDLLREAIHRVIESAAPAADLLGEMQQLQSGFVPQPQSFSVYE